MAYTTPTASHVFIQIKDGATPEAAYRTFLGAWRDADRQMRTTMVQEPLGTVPDRYKRWAVLLAATVEELSRQTDAPPPTWVFDDKLKLSRWWDTYGMPRLRPYLVETSPEPFLRRNILVGDRSLIKAGIGEQRGTSRDAW